MRIKLIKIVAGLLLLSSSCASDDQWGSIEGRVIDARTEQPIPQAIVVAQSGEGSAAKLPSTETNERGEFVLDQLPAGSYAMEAHKEQEWYPDTSIGALRAGFETVPKVVVRAGEVSRDVLIRLEKGGRVVGTVLDSQTHKPVVDSRLRLSRPDNPRLWTSIDTDERGHFAAVVPCAELLLEVSAPGYKEWSSGKARPNGRDVLRINPESTERLSILLQRK